MNALSEFLKAKLEFLDTHVINYEFVYIIFNFGMNENIYRT